MKQYNITLSDSDTLSFLTNLSTMLGSGISLVETMGTILEDSKGNMKKIAQVVQDDILQGKRLFEAFSRFPRVFDSVFVNILKASEEAGNLPETLRDLKESKVKTMEFQNKIRFALMYPALIFCVMTGVLITIMVVAVPKISQVFSRLHVDIPLPTQILIFLSNLLVNYTLQTIGVVVAVLLTLFFIYKRNKNLILQPLFSLPYVSQLVLQIDLTRFTRNLNLLLASGVPIVSALELTHDLVSSKKVKKVIMQAKNKVVTGEQLSKALGQHKKIIPSLMVKIIAAGEHSGNLDTSLEEISDYMDNQITHNLQMFTSLLEPIMLVTVGLLIGGIMLSIIAPIYGLIGQVGNR